jgi:DNA-binding transcriptional regulator LsrR (DeoR family)
MDVAKQELLARVAYLYDVENQIAKTLGMYRTTISRLLKPARETGVVTTLINSDFNWKWRLNNGFNCNT